jgi:hypothetical protein
MPLIEKLDAEIFESLTTVDLQILFFSAPIPLEDDETFIVPTKRFLFWVVGFCQLAAAEDIDHPTYRVYFARGLQETLFGHRVLDAFASAYASPFAVSDMEYNLFSRIMGPAVRNHDTLIEKSLQRLQARGLIEDPIQATVRRGLSVVFLGLLPTTVNARTAEGDALVARVKSVFYDADVKERETLPRSLRSNIRLKELIEEFTVLISNRTRQALEPQNPSPSLLPPPKKGR